MFLLHGVLRDTAVTGGLYKCGVTPDHSGDLDSTAAILAVRVWRENGEFRARITTAANVEHGSPQETVTASSGELEQLIYAWLFEIKASHNPC